MYNSVQESVFEGILSAALVTYIESEMKLLPTDDELSVMYPTSEKRLKEYRKKAKQKQRKAPTAAVYLKRVAVIALAVISVAFGVLMTNEGVRAAIVKSFITWYDKYVEFDFSHYEEPEKEEETDPITAVESLVIGYVPEGYVLSNSVEETGYREYSYMTDTGEYLLICLETSKGSSIGLDNENSDLEKFSLNGKDMYLAYNDTDGIGAIVFGNRMYMVSVSGLVAKDELIKVAENITSKKSNDKTITSDDLKIGYIPEGFELTSSDESSGHREYMYTSDNGDYITVGIYDSKYSDVGVDSENTEYEVLSVNGQEAHLMYDENDRCGVLLFGNSEYYVSIMALTDKSELIKIAENITVKQPQADTEAETVYDFVIGYIPEGFEFDSATDGPGVKENYYFNEQGDHLVVGIYESEGHSSYYDSENSEYEEITINGQNGYLMYNEAESTGSIAFGDTSFSVSITGKVAKEELIKIAENITVKQPQADAEAETVYDFVIGYIPEGFEFDSATDLSGIIENFYLNENGDYIMVGIYKSKDLSALLNTENFEYEEMTINGQNAHLMYNEAESTGTVVYGDASFAVGITGIVAKEELIKIAENITVKQPQDNAEESTKTFKDLEIGYIPENFELTSETEDNYVREYIYMADNGDYLMVGLYDSDSTSHSFDSENSEYEIISVNGQEAYLLYNSVERDGSVIMGNSSYHICITAICDKDELIKIAENIK